MQATLTRVGPYGVQTDQTGNNWIGGKFHKVNLKEFSAGQQVEIEYKQNGNYFNLISMKTLTGISISPSVTSTSVNLTKKYQTDPVDAERMARASANSAIYNSPLLSELLKNMDLDEAIFHLRTAREEAVNFILNGENKTLSTNAVNGVTNESK